MPQASGAAVKYAYLDHDSAVVNEAPPVQNQWYTVFDEENVRLIWCVVTATDLLAAGADIEVRWTCDGNVYFMAHTVASGGPEWVFRMWSPSTGGTLGLSTDDSVRNAAFNVDKRAQSFKVEVRVTSAVLATDILEAWCVYETLEVT